jgi:RNA polymerase sigma-70 factor (ECF subfamily)
MTIPLISRWPQRDVTTLEKMPLEHSEESLLAEARTTGPDSFRPIFNRYSKPLLVFIYSLVGDRDRAEELTQETFVRAYRRLSTIREGGRLSTWLFGIARNVVREAIKAKYRNLRKLTSVELLSSQLPDSGARPDEQVITGELHRMIQAALLKLPEDQRLVVVLKLIIDMPYEDISKVTGSSVGKLKTDLHRARHKMRESLQPYLRDRLYRNRGEL